MKPAARHTSRDTDTGPFPPAKRHAWGEHDRRTPGADPRPTTHYRPGRCVLTHPASSKKSKRYRTERIRAAVACEREFSEARAAGRPPRQRRSWEEVHAGGGVLRRHRAGLGIEAWGTPAAHHVREKPRPLERARHAGGNGCSGVRALIIRLAQPGLVDGFRKNWSASLGGEREHRG